MSITITITEDSPAAIFDSMRYFLQGEAREQKDMLSPAASFDTRIVEAGDGWQQKVAEPPKQEPEITPPVRKPRATKKADTVIQPDVTDAVVVVPEANPYAAMPFDDRVALLTPLMVAVCDGKGEDRVIELLASFKMKNRTEAAKSDKFGEVVAAFQAEVG